MAMSSDDDLLETPVDPETLAEDPETLAAQHAPLSGTVDDEDDRDDERDDENEAPIREHSDRTEAREEFQLDVRDEDPEVTDDASQDA